MRTHRGTTTAELNDSLARIMAAVRKRVDPNYIETFRCRGGCEDTGWVTVSTGEPGKAPTVRRCTHCGGPAPRRGGDTRGGSFS